MNDQTETSETTETVVCSTFSLTIELGNEAMQTDEDVARALHRLASWFEENSTMFEQRTGWVMDDNGNGVGHWVAS